MNRLYNPQYVCMTESVDHEKYVIASLLVKAGRNADLVARAAGMAIEQTTGTWLDVPGETPELIEKHVAKVVGLFEVPDYSRPTQLTDEPRWFIMRLAFPWNNFGQDFNEMLSAIPGNIAGGDCKLLDIEMPKSFVDGFKGPKFGLEGIRDILGVHEQYD